MDWNIRYATDEYVFGRTASQFVVRMERALSRRSRVLCVADGEGRNSVYLARQGHDVAANEFSAHAIGKAERLAGEAGVAVAIEQVDLAEWAWPEHRYDAVFAVFIQFAAPAPRDRVFAGLKRVVVPGGRIYLHGYTPKQLDYKTGGPPDLDKLYTETLLRASFADCAIELLRSYEAELNEGAGHSGRSALVDLVARTAPLAA